VIDARIAQLQALRTGLLERIELSCPLSA